MEKAYQRQIVDSRLNESISKTYRWFWQYGVVEGPDDSRRVRVPRSLEMAGSICYRRRVIWTGVTGRSIYRASGLASTFDGLEMWR
jgi:hypothetical protein